MSVNSIIILFVRPLFGRMIDMKGRKRICLLGILCMIFCFPFFHLITDAGWFPIVLRALTGVGWGISMTAIITMCSDLAPTERLGHSMGIIGIAGLVAQALGPFIGEEIVSRFGFSGLFNSCIIFAVCAFFLILITPEVVPSENTKKSKFLDILGKISITSLIIICALPLIHGAERGSVIYFVSLFINVLHLGRVGPFFLAFSISAIFTRLAFGDLSDRYGRKILILPGGLLICLNLVLISFINSHAMVIIAGFVGGFGQGLLFPALSSYIIDVFGRENKGFAISLYLSLFDVGIGIGAPTFGWICDYFDYRTMFRIAAIPLFIALMIFTWKAPTPGRSG